MRNDITRKTVGAALFSSLAFAVSLLEFPIFPAAGFLKLDFSAVFVLLGGFMYGPVVGVVICAVKELIRFIAGSGTGGIGEIANFIVITSFIIIPTVVYRFKKGLPVVVITLAAGITAMTAAALIANRFIMFPLYMGDGGKDAFYSLWYYIVFFNLIKGAAVSVIVFLLYKRLSALFKKINLRSADKNDTIKKGEVFISESEKDTFDIAKKYAETLKKGDVVLLDGELGAGKTVFVKGVAARFGIDGVVSPTYSYLNVYGDFIYHYDCYRLSSGEEAEVMGLTDYFGKDTVCLIEWAENIKSALPETVKTVRIDKTGENERRIYL